MSDLINRQEFLKHLEEKNGMNIPEWLMETINETPAVNINEIEESALTCAAELLRLVAKVSKRTKH